MRPANVFLIMELSNSRKQEKQLTDLFFFGIDGKDF